MKRVAIGLMAVTLGLNIFPFHGTLSFLTSEKKQAYSVSTGTNEDVFVTETEQLVLRTQVTNRVKVKRTHNADGSSSESTESRTSLQEGVQRISFIPQRDHLELDVENIQVTGMADDEVTVEKVEAIKGEEGIVFRIAHNRNKVDTANKTEKGELLITALGGFYSLKIPLTVHTSYSSSTEVSEEAAPGTPAPSGGTPSGSPAPSDPLPTAETPVPPTDAGTPVDSTDNASGPVPGSSEEPQTDSSATVQPETDSDRGQEPVVEEPVSVEGNDDQGLAKENE
ncbi:hypothetical protein [Brevibacillus reuszeri]|uniref:hypothetical protein n=1 Tax=Brevibacillus reuszeri TaxID=54915 RepID=UPI003D252608